MRGERRIGVRAAARTGGSSPHARGTLNIETRCPGAGRFIPACAGNARSARAAARSAAVHPRMRGERSSPNPWTTRSSGSSPHARGTRLHSECAGGVPTVHPRMRGERPLRAEHAFPYDGSSPHARGTLRNPGAENKPMRFIPACAGNADRSSPPADSRPVHPRMRGERDGGFCDCA